MRLLERNDVGQLSLTKDFGADDNPRYAILSHTWGPDTEEVTLRDMMDGTGERKAGYKKIQFCGEQARLDGLQYFWVDTCCIDKSNNNELSEAINSMFRWYRNAVKCYVYLSDVSRPAIDTNEISCQVPWEAAFRISRWFTRGWTLQELIAPTSVEFYSKDWEKLGDKTSLERYIYDVTRIPVKALRGGSLSDFSITERMSWAGKRETARKEDKTYSLLGIFGVYMPLIYGEGAMNAFQRLQEELKRRAKKRHLDEVSVISQSTFNPIQRSRTPCHHFSGPPCRDPNILDPELLFHSTHSINSIDTATKQSLIDQLYFTKIDERLTNLAAAQGTTCRWFLAKTEYKSWHDVAQQRNHDGFLWIRGNPGTGKSTLMKLLFEEANLKANGDPSQVTLSFFFLARGTAEEKSTTGLYRSLLHQLFEKALELRESLEWITTDGARVIQRNGWHEKALKQTLAHAIQKIRNRSLTIFVDALDECNKTQATDMVCFFEELCYYARQAKVRLKICFSSRHYPTIVIQKGIEVILEDEIGHKEDIELYIKSKLRLGKSKQAESLRSEILEKSSSIFLWVVLVLDILNTEYPESSISIKKIRERLTEIPPELSDLFEMIIARDGENLERLQVCLIWILYAARPLKAPELYFAIQLSLDKESLSYWDQEDIDLDQMKTFVRSSSKGLAEVTRNKAFEVQFIHESVRDFLIGKYGGQWSRFNGNFEGHGHEILRNCCLAQLNALMSYCGDIPDPLPQASKAAQLRETISLKFPFLEYSVLNVLYHANSAQQNAIAQDHFLADFPLKRWIFLNNTLERYDSRRYTETVSILYILAEKNLAHLIRLHPPRKSAFDVGDERYGPPLFAALATRSDEAVRVLLKLEAESQPLTSPLHDLCKKYCQDKDKLTKFGRDFTFSRKKATLSYVAEHSNEILLAFLVESGKYTPDLKGADSRTPLSWAAERGYTDVVKLLLEKGVEADSKDKSGRTPLSWAAGRGHLAVVKLLLDKGVEVDSNGDSNGDSRRTPLSWASEGGHEAMVKLLLDVGAKINSDRCYYSTPLMWAAASGHETVVKLLLDVGSEIDSKDDEYRTPLWRAAMSGHVAVVNLLLQRGAKAHLTDLFGRTLLSRASGNGNEAVVKLLLEKGTSVDLMDKHGHELLSHAAKNGHQAIVKLLLEEGAEVDSTDLYCRSPLSHAAESGHEAVVELLLERCAMIDSKDIYSRTPLWRAAQNGHEAVVKLLLKTGKVKSDLKDSHSQTPLSCAARNGHEAVIQLLLESDNVEVDSKDNDGQTPLLWAAQNGHEAVVQLLLETGKVEVNLKDSHGQTPLLWAAQNGHEAVVQLLLETGKVEVNLKDSHGQTPLLWAAQNGHEAVVQLLLETGKVEVNLKDSHGQTPLSCAAQKGHEAVVQLLLESDKVEVDSKDNDGQTPLLWAAWNGHEVVVKLLLETGKVEVNSRSSSYSRTPLWRAAQKGHEAVVKLETSKVEADLKDSHGQTPLSWAARNGHEAVVKLLLETGKVEVDSKGSSYGRTPLWRAARNGHKAVVKLLLETGKVEADLKDSYGQTPSFWATRNGHKAVFKLLSKHIT